MPDCLRFAEKAVRSAARAALLVLALAVLASCGFRRAGLVAQGAVRQFHARLDAQQYDLIYDEAGDSLKTSMTKSDFTAYLNDIHSRLGKVRKFTTGGFQINATAGQGTEVALAVETDFEQGAAEEKFLWRIQADRAVLMGYTADVRRSTGPSTVQASRSSVTRRTASGYFSNLFFFKFSRTIHWKSGSCTAAVSSRRKNPSSGTFSTNTLIAYPSPWRRTRNSLLFRSRGSTPRSPARMVPAISRL